MLNESTQAENSAAGTAPAPLQKRALDLVQRAWRPAGTVVAVVLVVLLSWHVFSGKHGVSVWQQKRAEDQQLRKEIEFLQQENALLRKHIERLKTDPEAIGHEAREKLHYAKPNEVIVTLQDQPQTQAQPAGAGK